MIWHIDLEIIVMFFNSTAGKDYPTNSLAALRKKFPGLELGR